jgi:hypothetical protein
MSAEPTTIISPAAWRYARERARIETRPVVEILARMLRLGIAADMAEMLTVRGQRKRGERTLPKAA